MGAVVTQKTQECQRCGRIRLVDPESVVLTPEDAQALVDMAAEECITPDGRAEVEALRITHETQLEALFKWAKEQRANNLFARDVAVWALDRLREAGVDREAARVMGEGA